MDKLIAKPPLGLIPEKFWEKIKNKQRLNSLYDAIRRYRKHKKEVPNEWLEEYDRRVQLLIDYK